MRAPATKILAALRPCAARWPHTMQTVLGSAGCSSLTNKLRKCGPKAVFLSDSKGSRCWRRALFSRTCICILVRFGRAETNEPALSLAPAPRSGRYPRRPARPSPLLHHPFGSRPLGQDCSVGSDEGLQNNGNSLEALLMAYPIASGTAAAITATATSLLAGPITGGPWRNNICSNSTAPPAER